MQNQDKTGTKANKQKPPPYEKKRTPDMGVRPGAQRMKLVSGIICLLLAVSLAYPGYVKSADAEKGQLSYPQEDVRQSENVTDGSVTVNDGQIDDIYVRLIEDGAVFAPSYQPSNSQDVLVRKKRRIGKLFKLIGQGIKGAAKLIKGSPLKRLSRLRPRGKPTVSRSGGRTTYQYTKRGGYRQATKDFNSLKPTDVKTYNNGATRVGKVGEYTVNVRTSSSGGSPTLEYFKTGQRTEVHKIRYP
ncbi:hypothetical protein FSP39_005351 [Pinctada imbricata]|uniref:Uncharacterized protein n=1 Tax=Pinctada imbricata TaxID=66713 RepID=A0AA88XYJ6_PINIB|nr:hypothetical protein FSP39_005351 [Pinctada imbricata]